MKRFAPGSRFGLLVAVLVAALASFPSALPTLAQGVITVSPNAVFTGTSSTVTLSASGFFDLSQVRASQIAIRPSEGVSVIQIVSATAQRLTISFRISEEAATGTRTLLITNSGGATVVALDLALRLGLHICRPACEATQTCRENRCVGCASPCQEPLVCRGNACVAPPEPPPPPPPLRCTPACRPGFECREGNTCLPLI